MSEYIPVTEFYIQPSVLWLCIFCGCANTERRHGIHHQSTGSHCDNCGAWYLVDWNDKGEPEIMMKQAEQESLRYEGE